MVSTMEKDKRIKAELSIYPLRQDVLGPAIESAVQALREAGLEPLVGAMSTAIQGDRSQLFAALERAFEAASATGGLVMTVHISNACRG